MFEHLVTAWVMLPGNVFSTRFAASLAFCKTSARSERERTAPIKGPYSTLPRCPSCTPLFTTITSGSEP